MGEEMNGEVNFGWVVMEGFLGEGRLGLRPEKGGFLIVQ